MPLRLVTGPANAGKTQYILGEALAAAAGASPVLAVPSLADVRCLESELSGKAPLGIRVVTLSQLARDLWSLYGDGRRIIDRATRDVLLRHVLREGAGPDISEAARTPGFLRLLARIVQRPPEAAPALRGADGPSAAVAGLVGRYRDALARAGMVESGWLGDILVAHKPQIGGPVGVVCFDALDVGQFRLIGGLARDNDVTIALMWEAAFAPTQVNDVAVSLLSEFSVEHVKLVDPPIGGEIQRLARALYSGPADVRGSGSVVTGLASGSEAEDALIARFVADEIESGTPAGRVVIAIPRAGQRADSLERALLARGVSADFDISQTLPATPFGRAWCSLLSLALGRGGRTEALAFLASPFSGVSVENVQALDHQWRRSRIADSAPLLASMGRLGGAAARAASLAHRVCAARLSASTFPKWQKLADLLLEAAICGSSAGATSRQNLDDAAAHRTVTGVLAGMARDTKELVVATEVHAACSVAQVQGDVRDSLPRVQVCDFGRVGSRRFDVVILGGLTEDEVSLESRDSIEEELRVGASREVEGAEADRERLLFYSLITRARSRLYLVRQEADGDGRERRASTLWEDALDAYRSVGATAEAAPVAPPPCVRMARADIQDFAPALTVSRREARSGAADLRLRQVERGSLTSPEGLAVLTHASLFSATEVEAYLECPYRWFYERVVRPEEIDAALDARELGTYAHGLLAAFYSRLAERLGSKRVTSESLDEALRLLDEVAAAASTRFPATAGLFEELAAARAVAWVRNVVAQDAEFLPGFVPESIELEFGNGAALAFAGSSFRGRIDRVDTSGTSAFVTDYKSSREVLGLAKFESEGKVQAVIYARAVEEVLGRPVSGSVYRSMRSGRLRGFWRSDLLGEMPRGLCEDDAIDDQGFAALLASTEHRVAEAIEGMRAGRIAREPRVKGACAYCSIAAFCEGASG